MLSVVFDLPVVVLPPVFTPNVSRYIACAPTTVEATAASVDTLYNWKGLSFTNAFVSSLLAGVIVAMYAFANVGFSVVAAL